MVTEEDKIYDADVIEPVIERRHRNIFLLKSRANL